MRFPEFTGEWEETILGKCVTQPLDYGMNAAAIAYDGENKYIRITDIDEQSSQYISDDPVSPAGQLLDKYIVEENDILFARTGASTGKTYLYKKKDGKLYFAGFLIRAKIKTEYNSAFIFAQTKTAQYYKWVEFMSIRSGQPRINSQEYASYRFLIPQKEEQDKIATFLSLLDSRIEAQIKIIEDLKLLKKTMSQNIFSLKIRFKDEEGNVFSSWKLRKLSDVLIIQGGYAFKSSLFNQGTNKVIRIGDILPIIKLSNFSGIYSSETPNEKYIVSKNDFVMALSGATFGKVGKIEDKGIAYINQRVATFRTKQCLEFFYQLVQINNFKNYISSIPTASAQPNISNDDIGNYKSYIPDVIEQTKIAGFLSTIDKKIATERAILDAYAKQKQYLLANLFI